ncbi:HD domain-containing protein [Pseudodesulfovibrio sp. zrk46]|uniref:HD domain-containing protein n=1 Tax=Pseudodesulfovibrio sp. zrk46 TaxID=2725288 RepID=UPI001448FC1D|nr:HD domain-containing protein [Pseudodesulfovibrio sp. zrk46]QJB58030.1 HD domain-containing protein [Pseudodesulfovibrio sp. zrk46]
MKTIHTEIWNRALPFQDKRDDAGHAFITLEYAKQLVDLENGDPDVVLPAIILHDTGWSRLSREEWMVVFSPTATAEDEMVVRLRHQEEGVNIAREILETMDYSTALTEEIVEIISEHDTRKGFISNNEGLMRDADKLWRFSKTGFDADVERFEIEPQSLYDKLVGQIPSEGFFYSETSRQLAYQELERRKKEFECVMACQMEAPELIAMPTLG